MPRNSQPDLSIVFAISARRTPDILAEAEVLEASASSRLELTPWTISFNPIMPYILSIYRLPPYSRPKLGPLGTLPT